MQPTLAIEHLDSSDFENALAIAVRLAAAAADDVGDSEAATVAGRAHLALGNIADAISWLEGRDGSAAGAALAEARHAAGVGGPVPELATEPATRVEAELADAMKGGIEAGPRLEQLLASGRLSTEQRIEALRARSNVEGFQQNWSAAIQWRERVVAEAPSHPRWLHELGQELFNDSRDDEAEAALRKSIRCGSSGGRAQVALGGLLLITERFAEAEALLRDACARRPADAEAWFYLTRSVMKQARPDEARHLLMRAAELGDSSAARWCEQHGVARPLLVFHTANHLLAAGELEAAVGQYEVATELWTSHREVPGDFFSRHVAMSRSNQGLALLRLGAYQLAEVELRAALEERPGLRDAHNHLGNLLEQTDRLDEALESFQRCAALDGRHAGAPYAEAKVRWRLGQTDAARSAIERAFAIGYADPQKQAELEERRSDILARVGAA